MNSVLTAGMSEMECRLGRVVAVIGARVSGHLQADLDPEIMEAIQVGGLLKICTRVSTVYGMVSALRLSDQNVRDDPVCMVDIDLLGEVLIPTVEEGRAEPGRGASEHTAVAEFRRGVSIYPGLGAGIHALTSSDLALVYAQPQSSSFTIGAVYHDPSIPARVATDRLLGKHFAILGTTGSGKSCAVALMLRSILENYPNGHVVLLDPHNEYAHAFGGVAELIDTSNLELPYWMMNFEELAATFVSRDGSDRQAEAEILKEAVLQARRRFLGEDADASFVSVDTPVPFRMSQAERIILDMMGKLDKVDSARPYLRLVARMQALQNDRRFAFLFSGLVVRDSMTDVLSRLLRMPVAGRPVTVFDLSGVPSEIVEVVVSLMCRTIFDFAVWSRRATAVPVLLVCEEAHRYVPQDERRGFEPTRRAIARIAKEGRKYGVSLCLVSQRPSELSTTILSQCNTLFSLRLTNDHDKAFVQAALPEAAGGLVAALPTLQSQEAVVVGDGVSLPMRIRFRDLDEAHRPQSATAAFSASWAEDCGSGGDRAQVRETVENWRRQQMFCAGFTLSAARRERQGALA